MPPRSRPDKACKQLAKRALARECGDTNRRSFAQRPARYWTTLRYASDETCKPFRPPKLPKDRKSTRLNSSHRCISYAVFCLKKKKKKKNHNINIKHKKNSKLTTDN